MESVALFQLAEQSVHSPFDGDAPEGIGYSDLRHNDGGNRAAANRFRFQKPHGRPLGLTSLCTPGMGVILSGESPVYETGSFNA